MDKQKSAPKPMLYIVQPDLPGGRQQMQDYFIWRKRKEEQVHPVKEIGESFIEEAEGTVPASQAENMPMAETELAPEAKQQTWVFPPKVEFGLEDDNVAADQVQMEHTKEEATVSGDAEISNPEKIKDSTKQTALVQYFLQLMKEKEVQPVETHVSTPAKLTDSKPAINELKEIDENKKKIWRLATTLARYPIFLERPYVQAVVNGEPIIFQIESKRGNKLRIKTGNQMKIIKIDDITELQLKK
ncbi:hypothetical protein [Bacillus sp. FJAT-27445]|uniref:hypothetical protein n=1 Tax=Bacillus sp. FJAT-27445 TaxID=1679166 RepID=UPI0007443FD4|nr:hypothetical protein [Bacillus sp. FJAT-27445]